MLVSTHIRVTLCQPPTLHVRIVFGEFQSVHRTTPKNQQSVNQRGRVDNSLKYIFLPKSLEAAATDSIRRIDIHVYIDSSTVRALYEGLLVTLWTTAQKRLQQRWSCLLQLAFVLVLLATLTIVGRCYASTNDAGAPLDKFYPRLQNNSIYPTSNLVLSRLLIPNRFVKSDTRVIREENQSELQFNRNSRTKREYEKVTPKDHTRISEGSASKKESLINDNLELLSATNNVSESIGAGNSSTRVTFNSTLKEDLHQNDGHFQEESHVGEEVLRTTQRPMQPAHAHDNESAKAVNALGIILLVVVLTGAIFGLVTCLLSHQWGTGGASGVGLPPTLPHDAADSPTTAPMLSVVSASAAGMGGMDRLRGGGRAAARELAQSRDRQVRIRAVHTDIAIGLPHSIAMPDGEEHPFTSARLHLRDAEQESEIYQKCIRPPPNRTVLESESPPPYRSSSAGMLPSSSSSSSGSDWSSASGPLVVRCHSMSSTSKPPATSSSHHYHPHGSGSVTAGQKTDFLQRTVNKIFTGGKKTMTQTTSQPPPAPSIPVVIVPTSRTSRNSTATQQSRPKQPPPPGV